MAAKTGTPASLQAWSIVEQKALAASRPTPGKVMTRVTGPSLRHRLELPVVAAYLVQHALQHRQNRNGESGVVRVLVDHGRGSMGEGPLRRFHGETGVLHTASKRILQRPFGLRR